jgi:hypothetical protein
MMKSKFKIEGRRQMEPAPAARSNDFELPALDW